MKFSAKKEKAILDEALSDDGMKSIFIGKAVKILNEVLMQEASEEMVLDIMGAFTRYTSWAKMEQAVAIYDGQTSEVDAVSFQMSFWLIRLSFCRIENPNKEVDSHVPTRDVLELIAQAIVFGRDEEAFFLGEKLYASAVEYSQKTKTPEPPPVLVEISESDLLERTRSGEMYEFTSPSFEVSDQGPFCGLMLRLYAIMKGLPPEEPLPSNLPQCGPYEGLFKYWHNERKLSKAISKACDYHLKQTLPGPDDQDENNEFEFLPFSVAPVEILAFREIRRSRGLETPFPKHSLLDNPFTTNLPTKLPPSNHELFAGALLKAQEVYPDLRELGYSS